MRVQQNHQPRRGRLASCAGHLRYCRGVTATCFFDYTCAYSFRFWRWVNEQVRPLRADLTIRWVGFSIKEVNRSGPDSVFSRPDDPRLSVLALALGAAAEDGGFRTFHAGAFGAFHQLDRRATRDDLLHVAATAGLDADTFWRQRERWVGRAAEAHYEAVRSWGVFGTPTLLIENAPMYVRLTALPRSPSEGVDLWDAVADVTRRFAEVAELKRP